MTDADLLLGYINPDYFCGGELGITTIIIPFMATSHSAFGAAVADLFRTYKLSDPQPTPVPAETLANLFARTDGVVYEQFERDGIPRDQVKLRRWVEMRYRRQVHEIAVPFTCSTPTDADVARLIEAFEEAYSQLYGKESGFRAAGIDVITFRSDGHCPIVKPKLVRRPETSADARPASKGTRPIYLIDRQAFADAPIYDGTRLLPGNRVIGPAVIEHYGTTVLLEPGSTARVDVFGNTFLHLDGALS